MKINTITSTIETGLSHYWYPLGYSKNLLKNAKKPKRFVLLDTPIVLWRADDKWFAHKDICPHRQAPLSAGKVINNTLNCPYHGWAFKPCGTLSHIPTLPEKDKPKSNPCLTSFSVYDDDFMVWVCLQNETRLAPPKVAHYNSNTMRTLRIEKTFANNIDDIIENFMDSPHTLYIHNGLIRNDQQLTPRLVEVSMQEHEVLVSHQPSQEDISLLSRLINPKAKLVSHTDKFTLPSHVHIDYYFGSDDPVFSAWVALSPIHANETKLFISITLNFGWKNYLLAPIARLLAERILWQDRQILKLQSQNLTYEKTRNACSSRGDCTNNYVRTLRHHANANSKPEKIATRAVYLNL